MAGTGQSDSIITFRGSSGLFRKKSRPPRRHLVSMRLLGLSAGVYRRLIASKTVAQYSQFTLRVRRFAVLGYIIGSHRPRLSSTKGRGLGEPS